MNVTPFVRAEKKKKRTRDSKSCFALFGGGGAEGGVCFWFTEWEKREKTFFKFL